MVATAVLEKRLTRLEEAYGDSLCERCSGTTIVIDCSDNISVVKNGSHLTPEASLKFHREEQPHGQCPECGNFRERVRVGWGQLR